MNLIAVGDGGPGPLLPRVFKRKKRKPLLPGEKEIARLPRWARVAFAARCARRVLPLIRRAWPEAPAEMLATLATRVAAVEQAASTATSAAWAETYEQTALPITDAVFRAHLSIDPWEVLDAANAVHFADRAASGGDDFETIYRAGAMKEAARAMLHFTSDPRDLLCFRRDFERFRRLARKHGWTDETPVSPHLVGPLWPPGRTPRWARGKKKPRE